MGNYRKLMFLIVTINLICISCYYPKVNISNDEYNSIVYQKKQNLIFENKDKIQDTLLIYLNYPKGFEPNFDYWWNKKVYKSNTTNNKRTFSKKYVTYANLEKNKYKKANLNVNLIINYSKNEDDNGMTLSTDNFKEKYNLNNFTVNDTLIFIQKENVEDCKTENCLKKIKYLKSIGIVYLEKGNGEIWKLK